MITVKQLAEIFENGLNNQLDNPEIKFKIWANAGEYKKPYRDGNTVTHYITGNLRTSTSTNDANRLAMGVNGLTLDFMVPITPPKTNAMQTEAELAKIDDEQYPFITYIANAINGYFQRAQTIELKDENKVEFTLSFKAGVVIPGSIDISARYGNSITISAYIEVYFIEGGISSKNVLVYFDNQIVPFMVARQGRTPVFDSDIYAGKLVSKNIVTSSAFAIDIDFPANGDRLTQESVDYLLKGEPNTAYFVKLVFGSKEERYLMTFNSVQYSAQGISVAGGSLSLVETVENVEALNFPDGYQIGRFKLDSSTVESISFFTTTDCTAFIAGNIEKWKAGERVISISPNDVVYDEADGAYYVYLVTDTPVRIFRSGVPFNVI